MALNLHGVGGAGARALVLLPPGSLGTRGGYCALVSPFGWRRQRRVCGLAWFPPFLAPASRFSQGGGCALMNRAAKFQQIVRGMNQVRPRTPPPPPRPGPAPADRHRRHRCWTCR